MPKSVAELKNKHPGSDIYVVCSGPSMNYIDSDFFSGRITIGINDVWKKFHTSYNVRMEAIGSELVPSPLINSEYIVAGYDRGRNTHYDYMYKHRNASIPVDDPTVGFDSDDHLIVGASTVIQGLHLAAIIGAKNIILCGHDCGLLDEQENFSGYYDQKYDYYKNWLFRIERETLIVKKWLIERYQVNVYSLNPFVNFGLEGHNYIGCRDVDWGQGKQEEEPLGIS